MPFVICCLHAACGALQQKESCSSCGLQRVGQRQPQSSFPVILAGEVAGCQDKISCSQHSKSSQLQLLLKTVAELLKTKHFASSGKKSMSESKTAHTPPSIVLFGNLPLLNNPFQWKVRNDENNILIWGFDNTHLCLTSKYLLQKSRWKFLLWDL